VNDVSIEDGINFTPGQPFIKIWKMRNEGPIPWPESTRLIFVGGDKISNLEYVYVPSIEVNGEVDISVEMQAPSKPGRYVSYWRLVTPDGVRFGQRVWADITVTGEKEKEEKKIEQVVPKPMTPISVTPVPSTPVPSTPTPSTPVPSTPTPSTPVPSTPTPLTPVPSTVPSTPPSTPVPSTVPSTPVPSTPVPSTQEVIPEVVAPQSTEIISPQHQQLLDMGFFDKELNKKFLSKHNNDVIKTVQELLNY